MKKILLLTAILFTGMCFAQTLETINNYKYVIVPEKFEFFKEKNQYNLNTYTKMVFEKQGFKVFFSNDKMPDELALNKCMALYGDLINDSGMLATNLFIVIKDCGGKVLFTSERGRSKQKEYPKAYLEALREASNSLTVLNYQYAGPAATPSQPLPPAVPVQPVAQSVPAPAPTPVNSEGLLFAQPIANGYQLVDSTPRVVLKMYRTSQPDSYSAQADGKIGVVFKKGNDWLFEYYVNDKLVSEKLNIKF